MTALREAKHVRRCSSDSRLTKTMHMSMDFAKIIWEKAKPVFRLEVCGKQYG